MGSITTSAGQRQADRMLRERLRRHTRGRFAPRPVIWALLGVSFVGVQTEPWSWPVSPPFGIVRHYLAPAHAYGPGHRGIDIVVRGDTAVRAPDDGIVAYAGRVVDRSVVTIDHGDGIVSTLEPVEATVVAGERVARGEVVGMLSTGGHTEPGALHLGARLQGEYVNPLVLLGAMPRAVLLPDGDPSR